MKKKVARVLGALVVFLSVVALGCQPLIGDDTGDTDIARAYSMNRFQTVPYAGTDENRVKYSYSYGGYDFYYIYLGELKNTPLYFEDAYFHSGMIEQDYKFGTRRLEETQLREVITRNSYAALSVINESTLATTTGAKIAVALEEKAGFGFVDMKVKTSAEVSFNLHLEETQTTGQEQSTSLENTVEQGTSRSVEYYEERTFRFTKDVPAGYFRWTSFVRSDVYVYVIRNSETKEIVFTEFREHIIPDSYSWTLDYSEDGSFKKNNLSSFELDPAIVDDLPDPVVILEEEQEAEPPVSWPVSYLTNFVLYRTDVYDITDTGTFGQPYDAVSFSEFGVDLNTMKANGYTKISFYIQMDVRETTDNDGWQELYLFNSPNKSNVHNISPVVGSPDSNYPQFAGIIFEHYPGVCDTSWWRHNEYELKFEDIPIDSFLADTNQFILRFGAHGNDGDHWRSGSTWIQLLFEQES